MKHGELVFLHQVNLLVSIQSNELMLYKMDDSEKLKQLSIPIKSRMTCHEVDTPIQGTFYKHFLINFYCIIFLKLKTTK